MAFVLRSLFQEFEDNFSFDYTLMGKHCCFFVVKDSQNSPTLPDFMSLSMFLANWHLQASGMTFGHDLASALESRLDIKKDSVWSNKDIKIKSVACFAKVDIYRVKLSEISFPFECMQ